MNVKQVASILGKSQSHIIEKCRALGFQKVRGQYHLDKDDLERIKKRLTRKPGKSVIREIAILGNIQKDDLIKFAYDLRLRFKRDREKILYACKLMRTGYYTLKGIKWMLENMKHNGRSMDLYKGLKNSDRITKQWPVATGR